MSLLTDNKTVLHCIATMEGGGAERQICYLAKGLVEHGWIVHVAIIKRGTNFQRLKDSGAIIHELDVKNNYSLGISKQLVKIIRTVRPSLVQCWQRPMDVFSALAAMWTGTPFISVERTLPDRYAVSLKGILKFCIAQFCSGNVSNSTEGKKYWDKWLLRKIPNVMIPNIIPFDELPFRGRSGEVIESIVVIGRLSKEKNIHVLIDAMKIVVESKPHIKLDIVGTGAEKDELSHRISELKLMSNVFLHGYREDAWDWVNKAGLFISLSLYEGMPNAVMEAAAIGVPMLLSDIPAHTLFFNKDSATFSNPHSANEIAGKINGIFQDYPSAIAKTYVALQSIESNNRQFISKRYIEFYHQVI